MTFFGWIARGAELYVGLEAPEQVDRLIDGRFPVTQPQDPIDSAIISGNRNAFEKSRLSIRLINRGRRHVRNSIGCFLTQIDRDTQVARVGCDEDFHISRNLHDRQ